MQGQIVFLQQPKNVTVFEGITTFFACTYGGINVVPRWRINNEVFVASALPRGHSYHRSGLVISSVDLSLNMTSYSCFFTVYQGGRLMDVESTTGFLKIGLHNTYIMLPIIYTTCQQVCKQGSYDMEVKVNIQSPFPGTFFTLELSKG